MSDTKTEDAATPKKKRGLVKLLVLAGGALALVGGGVGAGVYASGAGLVGGDHAAAEDDGRPKLVPKSEQKRGAAADGEGHGGDETPAPAHGKAPPAGSGGDRYASNYYALDKDFTSNLRDSVHMVQVGIAVSTPYDDTVIDNLKTNDIAIRSTVLMTLGDTEEEQVFTAQGKQQLAKRLTKAINDTLTQKEGFGGVANVYFTSFVVQ